MQEFLNSAIDILSNGVMGMGAIFSIWGVMNLFEGYGSDNPGARSQGIKQMVAGIVIFLIGFTLLPQLKTMFTITQASARVVRMAAMALRIVQGGIRRVFASEGALRVAMFIRRMFI